MLTAHMEAAAYGVTLANVVPDYETMHLYTFTVVASDGTKTAEQTVTLNT